MLPRTRTTANHTLVGLLLLLVTAVPLSAQDLPIVPRPRSVTEGRGVFTLGPSVRVAVKASAREGHEIRSVADQLAAILRRGGVEASIHSRAADAPIVLEVVGEAGRSVTARERYALAVTPGGIRISSPTTTGLFWGVQSLRQLLPVGFEGRTDSRPSPALPVAIPAVTIEDEPRFGWRGALLDVGRHFFTVSEIERFIDLLALHKMNVLHWHLTEDQGWRIEIRGYPRLTSLGAWRVEADGTRYGGYYTREQVRGLVEYARRRHITIVPEIEMPGHSTAALVAYPEFGCRRPGPAVVPTTWGVFPDVYCAGNDETFRFLQRVLDEVMDLFPSRLIHIGGDEVPKDHWKTCALCQARMRAEGLRDESELQSDFIKRIAAYLESKGRQLAGWDEILEGGLAKGATVQVWRDVSHVATAVRAGSQVIASPTSHAYINRSPAELPLATVLTFNPVPSELSAAEAESVLGGEATIWTEHIDAANFDQVVFPRLSAMAEALWSGPSTDAQAFRGRLARRFLPRLQALGVSPGPEDRALLTIRPFFDRERVEAGVRVEGAVEGLVTRYTTDGSTPTAASPRLGDGTRFSASGTIRVQPFIKGRPTIDRRTLRIERHLAVGLTPSFGIPHSPTYPGTGVSSLADGLHGSPDFHDGLWQGWEGTDADITLDLGESKPVSRVTLGSLQVMRSWILLPQRVSLALSEDGRTWTAVGEAAHAIEARTEGPLIHPFEFTLPSSTRARFLRVDVANAGPLPSWHPGAGAKAWIFLDELVVR